MQELSDDLEHGEENEKAQELSFDHDQFADVSFAHHYTDGHHEGESDDHDEDFGEIVVHQLIETIEFVLGSISNTASYLRLWALSLAHGQLASVTYFQFGNLTFKVFLDLLMGSSLREPTSVIGGTFGIILGYGFLTLATSGVLLCMDAMECFLHALRLHW